MNMQQNNMTNGKNINSVDDSMISDPVMEAQIARGISDLLKDRAQHLSPEQEQRLSAARDAAVSYLAERQAQHSTDSQISGHGHVLRWFGHHVGQNFEQHRVASTVLLVSVMLLTFFAVQQFGFNNNLENSDAFLLASDLPPEAYADKGFDAWIESN
jgi:uncharacterized protein YbjQ (UPF0145 family)